jgi:hypothetical protein
MFGNVNCIAAFILGLSQICISRVALQLAQCPSSFLTHLLEENNQICVLAVSKG